MKQIVRQKTIRIPPQGLEAEMALIGSVMLRPDAFHEIIDLIRPDSFYSERNRVIWTAILDLTNKGAPVDLLSLSSCLAEKKLTANIGGSGYLAEVVNSVPSSANVRYYAELIHKKYIMRELIHASEKISDLGYEEASDIQYLVDQAEKMVYDIAHKGTTHKFIELKDALTEAWDRIDALHKSSDVMRGVPTGFKELDNKLAGLQKSDLIILAARPSMGKTSLALDIARQAAIVHKIPVGIFSLEMSSQQLVDRMLAADAQVDAWKLRTGKLTAEEDFDRIRDSLGRLSSAPIYIDDQPGASILKMRSTARKLKSEKNLGLIVVDYLQLIMPATQGRNNDNVVQQITEISRALKQLAREMDVPVLALSQLSRAVEQRGGKPRLSDLRDSGSIEQDADVVMFIHREDKQKEDSGRPNIAEIMIEKHRNGPTGKAELYFDDKKSSFLSIDKNFGGMVGGSSEDF